MTRSELACLIWPSRRAITQPQVRKLTAYQAIKGRVEPAAIIKTTQSGAAACTPSMVHRSPPGRRPNTSWAIA